MRVIQEKIAINTTVGRKKKTFLRNKDSVTILRVFRKSRKAGHTVDFECQAKKSRFHSMVGNQKLF